MNKVDQQATHEGRIQIGNYSLRCYVLNNKQRIVNKDDFLSMLGEKKNRQIKYSEALQPLLYATTKLNKSTSSLLDKIKRPIPFKLKNGITLHGYEGTLITDYCKSVLRARKWGFTRTPIALAIAEICEDIVVSLANVGIIALIDEATYYQRVRVDNELQIILDSYLAKYLGPWEKHFQDEYYENLFRLKGWDWSSCKVQKKNKPSIVGKITKDIVYSRMAPGLIDELEKLNPIIVDGKRASKHHQWLTPNIGQIALKGHLFGVIALMKCSNSWFSFYSKLQVAYPRLNEQMELRLWDEYDSI